MEGNKSGIYLIYLGSYKELKGKFNFGNKSTLKYKTFDDTDGIYKFGKTKNLNQRISQHKSYYESIIGQGLIHREFKLLYFKSLSSEVLTVCENKVKEFCIDNNFHFIEDSNIDTHHNELVVIKNNKLNLIEEFYKELKH